MRALVAVGCLLLGAAVAVAAVALHQLWWGLLLGLAGTLAALLALPGGWARTAYAAGFLALLLWVMGDRSEGDYVIPANGAGYAVLGLGVAVFLGAVVTLPGRREPGGSARPR